MYIHCQLLLTCWNMTCVHWNRRRNSRSSVLVPWPDSPCNNTKLQPIESNGSNYNPIFFDDFLFFFRPHRRPSQTSERCWSDCQTYISCQIHLSDLKSSQFVNLTFLVKFFILASHAAFTERWEMRVSSSSCILRRWCLSMSHRSSPTLPRFWLRSLAVLEAMFTQASGEYEIRAILSPSKL